MLIGYSNLLDAISRFKNREMEFLEFKQWMLGTGSSIGPKLDYDGDFYSTLDAWVEYIEHWYSVDEQYDLACSLANFVEDAIKLEPKPLTLPLSDRVVRDHFRKVERQSLRWLQGN